MNFQHLSSSNMNTEPLTDKLKDYEYFLLTVIDVLISFLVVAPCTVASWRGLWEYLEHKHEYFPEWIYFLGASFFHFMFSLFRSELLDFSKNLLKKSKFLYNVFSRVYIYLFLICCIVQWRCIWNLLDTYLGRDHMTLIMYTVPSLIVLYSFRLFKNVLAPPYYIEMDYNVEDVFNFGTLWSYPVNSDKTQRVEGKPQNF
ncbi:hypothetical protein M8J75_008275 [Diaphorina citri]|nr:hypothetical protein M8J75_008275 [Diaphorina citri]